MVHAGCRDGDAHLDETRRRLGAVISASQWVAHPRSTLADIVDRTAHGGLDVLTGDVSQSREGRLVAAGGVGSVVGGVVQPAVELAPAFGLGRV